MLIEIVMTTKDWIVMGSAFLLCFVLPVVVLCAAVEQGCKNPYAGKYDQIVITIERVNLDEEKHDNAQQASETVADAPSVTSQTHEPATILGTGAIDSSKE